jgi:predicted flap endonuclease-1-like 5' DNA nuclease
MSDAAEPPRQTLAMRLAARNGQRELRAARLARLRAIGGAEADGEAGDEAALRDFMQALGRAAGPSAPSAPAAAIRRLHAVPAPATAPEPPCDLDRLPGAGPGLVQALRRAGLRRLADVAGLEPAELAARLGPIGRLVPAESWIAAARARGGGPA